MQTAIWSPAAGPFTGNTEPMGVARKLSQVKWTRALLGPTMKTPRAHVRKFTFLGDEFSEKDNMN